jgi:6-phosphogluconolactonase (cycloisomerase 2 family)
MPSPTGPGVGRGARVADRAFTRCPGVARPRRHTNPSELYVSNAHGGTGAGTVSAFRDGWNGNLTSIGSSPFADQQTAPRWVEITHDGRLNPDGSTLSVVDSGTAQVSTFRVHGGALTEPASSPTALPARSAPFGIVTT